MRKGEVMGLEAVRRLRQSLDEAGPTRPITEDELEGLIMANKAKAKGNTPLVAFRLSPELLERLDAHRERMAKVMPGLRFTRTDAVRALLESALERAERGSR